MARNQLEPAGISMSQGEILRCRSLGGYERSVWAGVSPRALRQSGSRSGERGGWPAAGIRSRSAWSSCSSRNRESGAWRALPWKRDSSGRGLTCRTETDKRDFSPARRILCCDAVRLSVWRACGAFPNESGERRRSSGGSDRRRLDRLVADDFPQKEWIQLH